MRTVGLVTARLLGHTAIVAVDRPEELAHRLALEGARVVLVGSDGRLAGELAGAIAAEGAPGVPAPAVFCGDPGTEEDRDALIEMITELSRAGHPTGASPGEGTATP